MPRERTELTRAAYIGELKELVDTAADKSTEAWRAVNAVFDFQNNHVIADDGWQMHPELLTEALSAAYHKAGEAMNTINAVSRVLDYFEGWVMERLRTKTKRTS